MTKEKVHFVSQYFYSQIAIDVTIENSIDKRNILMLLINVVILVNIFVLIYKKRRNEE